MVDVVELHLLIQLVNHLLVVDGQISVPVSEVVQDVPEMGSVSVDEVAAILVFGDIVSSREHNG